MPTWLKNALIFSAGGAVGFFVSKAVYKKRFEKDLNEQIASVKEAFRADRKHTLEVKKKDEPKEEAKVDDGTDPKFNEDLKPTDAEKKEFFRPSEEVQSRDDSVMKPPREVTPDSVGTPDGYPDMDDVSAPPFLLRDKDFGDQEDQCEWILWADGVVTTDDSTCEIVSPDKVAELLPPDWKEKFGWDIKYQNQIYYRNNINRLDIAIYKDNRTYKEWLEEAYPARYLEEYSE